MAAAQGREQGESDTIRLRGGLRCPRCPPSLHPLGPCTELVTPRPGESSRRKGPRAPCSAGDAAGWWKTTCTRVSSPPPQTRAANSSSPLQAVTSDMPNAFAVLVKPGSVNPVLELARGGWFQPFNPATSQKLGKSPSAMPDSSSTASACPCNISSGARGTDGQGISSIAVCPD